MWVEDSVYNQEIILQKEPPVLINFVAFYNHAVWNQGEGPGQDFRTRGVVTAWPGDFFPGIVRAFSYLVPNTVCPTNIKSLQPR
jgi:hypothetical protein